MTNTLPASTINSATRTTSLATTTDDYFLQAGIYNPTDLLSYRSYFNTRYQNALLAETHTFTSNMLNNLVANYQRMSRPARRTSGKPGHHRLWRENSGSRHRPLYGRQRHRLFRRKGRRRLRAGSATTTPSTTTCTG
jgi:hypothetical protein